MIVDAFIDYYVLHYRYRAARVCSNNDIQIDFPYIYDDDKECIDCTSLHKKTYSEMCLS